MKTSNKLIFILTLAFLFSLTSLMVYAKSNLTTWDESYTENPGETKEFLADYSTNVLRLDADYNFYLDDQKTGVTIDASPEAMGYLREADEESLIFYREGAKDLPFGSKVDVYIGVQGKDDLEIIAGNNARVRSKGVLEFEKLRLKFDDNSNVRIDISADELDLQAENNIRLNLDGYAKTMNLRSIDNASINARDFSTDNLIVDINGNSKVDFDQAQTIAGTVRDNGSFTADSQENNENLRTQGNGYINIR